MSIKDCFIKTVKQADYVEIYWGVNEHQSIGHITRIDDDVVELANDHHKRHFIDLDAIASFSLLDEHTTGQTQQTANEEEVFDYHLPTELVFIDKYWQLTDKELIASELVLKKCNTSDSSKPMGKKLLSLMNKIQYALKINELDYKYGRLKPFIFEAKELCNLYQHDFLYELLALLLRKGQMLYNEVFQGESHNKFILLSDAMVCQKRQDDAKMAYYLSCYYDRNHLSDINIDNLIYAISYLFAYGYDDLFYYKFKELSNISPENEKRFRHAYEKNKNVERKTSEEKEPRIENTKNIIAYLKKEVQKYIYANDFYNAYKIVEDYFNKDPQNEELAELLKYVAKIEENFKKYDYQMPSNKSNYSLGKREWHIYENIEQAEKYFRKSIKLKESKAMSAVLDLVDMTYRNHNALEALDVLLSYRHIMRKETSDNRIKYHEKLCSLYECNKDLDNVINTLNSLKNQYHSQMHYYQDTKEKYQKYKDKYGGTILRIARCLYNQQKYVKAIKTAKEAVEISENVGPCVYIIVSAYANLHKFKEATEIINNEKYNLSFHDRDFMLERIELVKQQLQQENEDVLQSEISQDSYIYNERFISCYEKSCVYEGISDERKADRNFEEKDLDDLCALISDYQLRNDAKPRDLASLMLSAAMMEKAMNEMSNKYYEYLSSSFSYYSKFLLTIGKFNNAKSYCLYAIRLKNHKQEDYEEKMKNDIANYCLSILKEADIYEFEGLKLDNKINILLTKIDAMMDDSFVVNDVIQLLNTSELFKTLFYEQHLQYPKIEKALCEFFNLENIDLLSKKLRTYEVKTNAMIKDWLNAIKNDKNIEMNLDTHFYNVKTSMYVNELDKKYLMAYAQEYNNVQEYNEFNDIDNKKRILTRCLTGLKEIKDKIDQYPSAFSENYMIKAMEYTNQNINNLLKRLEEEYQPELSIHVPLDKVIPNNGEVSLSVTIKNAENKATARKVILKLLDVNGHILCKEKHLSCNNLIGGSESYELLHFKMLNDDAFSIHLVLTYQDEDGHIFSLEKPVSISVDNENFEPIVNPYIIGNPVEDDAMFFGRDVLMKQLSDGLKDDKIRCVVIYGQKRTGKTSIFTHLKKRLQDQFIILNFSIGADITSVKNFYQSVQLELVNYLEDHDYDEDTIAYYEDYEIEDNTSFRKFIAKVNRNIGKKENKELLLMIDEFTHLYRYIKDDRYDFDDTFMEAWKFMIETKLFKAALIGQDFMLDFINAYANQFQISEPIIVDYLDKQSSIDLIQNPIALPNGNSRFLENSSDIIYEWFHGQPFYLQKYCRKLVDYMNSEVKQNYITIAIAASVKEDLLKSVQLDFFDNLVRKDETIALNVLLKIVKHLNSKEGRVNIKNLELCKEEKQALDQLAKRGVINYTKNDQKCNIVIPFFYEWLKSYY